MFLVLLKNFNIVKVICGFIFCLVCVVIVKCVVRGVGKYSLRFGRLKLGFFDF